MFPDDFNFDETLAQIDLLLHNATRRGFVRMADCDDLRQDIFIAVVKGINQYDVSRASWPTFLATIIQSEIHRFRLKKRWMKHCACESIHDLEEEDHPLTNDYPVSELNDVEQVVFRSEIRQAVAELPDDLQTICQLLTTMPQAQIADMLGIEPQIVSQKVSQIRKLLFDSKIVQDYL